MADFQVALPPARNVPGSVGLHVEPDIDTLASAIVEVRTMISTALSATDTYPDLDTFIAAVEAGTVADGQIVLVAM